LGREPGLTGTVVDRHPTTQEGRDAGHRHRSSSGHFHNAEELEHELRDAGLTDVELQAIEGSAGLALEQIPEVDDELLQAALTVARRTGHLPGVRDLSNHLMAIGRV
jgi:hypothetical protein